MKYHYLFLLKSGATIEDAFLELEPFLCNIYEMDDPETGIVQIGGYSDQNTPPQTLCHVVLEKLSPIEEIDWQQQWSDFATDFHDGFAHIDLKDFGGPMMILKPGAGFGDLSHPTTRLTLSLMASNVQGKVVFDIGSGSGILSIAAIFLGAQQAWGIDIDLDAVAHAQENARLNQIEDKALFSASIPLASVPKEPFVVVMNMIESEQIVAWESLPQLHSKKALIITSGILISQREQYLKIAKSWSWILQEEKEEEEWLGFLFTKK